MLTNQAIALMMIRVRDAASTMPATQVAASLRQTADVAERLLGGVAPTFAQVIVELPAALAPKPPTD